MLQCLQLVGHVGQQKPAVTLALVKTLDCEVWEFAKRAGFAVAPPAPGGRRNSKEPVVEEGVRAPCVP